MLLLSYNIYIYVRYRKIIFPWPPPFKEFKASVETELGMKIKALRADRGGEYMSEEFKFYLKECGIKSELTAAYSPQQNGVSE